MAQPSSRRSIPPRPAPASSFARAKASARSTPRGAPPSPARRRSARFHAACMTEICEAICAEIRPPRRSRHHCISVPGGEEIAQKTGNPTPPASSAAYPFWAPRASYILSPVRHGIHSIHRGIDVGARRQQNMFSAQPAPPQRMPRRALYNLPDFAILDKGRFCRRRSQIPALNTPSTGSTIAGGLAKLTKLAQGALDLHSSRSQVDKGFLWQIAERAGAPAGMKERILLAEHGNGSA